MFYGSSFAELTRLCTKWGNYVLSAIARLKHMVAKGRVQFTLVKLYTYITA